MTPLDDNFEGLLRGHATLTLTAQEREALGKITASDRARAAEVAGFDQVHAAFARERALFGAVSAPVEAAEEADEGFARLAAAGARAEAELRGRLLHAPAPVVLRPRRRGRRVVLWAVAALAAGTLVALALDGFSGPPALQQGTPGREVAGGELHGIVIAPHLSAADRTLSWSPLWHAVSYDVVIVDARGNVVLQRAPDQARSTRWELTTREFDQLCVRQAELRLRVHARDGAGLSVGTSGDVPLTIR